MQPFLHRTIPPEQQAEAKELAAALNEVKNATLQESQEAVRSFSQFELGICRAGVENYFEKEHMALLHHIIISILFLTHLGLRHQRIGANVIGQKSTFT